MPPSVRPFDWQSYFVLADALSRIDSDSARRSAISRAYYAAFHKAEKLYSRSRRSGVPDLGNESHHVVWAWFKTRHSQLHRKIGAAGDRLKQNRIRADYRDEFPGLHA